MEDTVLTEAELFDEYIAVITITASGMITMINSKGEAMTMEGGAATVSSAKEVVQ
jgi:hypothetical protein